MDNFDLNERFLCILRGKFSKQATLISVVEDVLKIERESAYRRIRGFVQFTIREMGLLAMYLNISLDNLMIDDETDVVHLQMLNPRKEKSIENRTERIEDYLKTIQNASTIPDIEVGAVYSHLPMEFYIPYENLFKFIYYRWGLYYVGPEKCGNFASWKMPNDVYKYHPGIMEAYGKLKKVLYIWDKSVIGDLVSDVKFFASAGVLEEKEVTLIKKDLHSMLTDMENLVAAGGPESNFDKMEFYISNIKIGVTYVYAYSESYKFSYIVTLTIISDINEDGKTCENVMKWVKSLKKISTLISGTGDKERLLFFREQHQIVDTI